MAAVRRSGQCRVDKATRTDQLDHPTLVVRSRSDGAADTVRGAILASKRAWLLMDNFACNVRSGPAPGHSQPSPP